MFKIQIWKIIFLGIIFFFLPVFASADYIVNQTANFSIDPSYDLTQRTQTEATLKTVTPNAYFYLDNDWWNSLTSSRQSEVNAAIANLTAEFNYKIYPTLTSTFGFEWKPGVDNNLHIIVLIHPMKGTVGGYFNSGDEYLKIQNPNSNEAEMIYLNTKDIVEPQAKSFLAHEFVHLITFNQKEKIQGVSEEVWLNEIRAEYASTLLGYDDNYQGSNLEQRVKQFINSPSNSLTEWQNQEADYGVINLFTQYLVDHYGIKILTDSLHSSKIGISSINEALKKNNFQKDFSQIFTDWLITTFVNSCRTSPDYCYINRNLQNFRISPSLIFLPSTQRTGVSLNYSIKQWSGNWYRIIGGNGDLTLHFDGEDAVNFKVSYVLCPDSEICEVHFLNLDGKQNGEIFLPDFDKNWRSLTLIPSIQSKISGFGEEEPLYPLSISISIKAKTDEEKLIEGLLAQIEELKKEIARLQQLLANAGGQPAVSCQSFSQNLYYGVTNSSGVRCLQEFLKARGTAVYPEGVVSGNYLSLTTLAVKRYQASKGIIQTGYFGPLTRTAANADLGL